MNAINTQDITKIGALLTTDHQLIDAAGKELNGKEITTSIWSDYFKLFPDYRIEITEVFIKGATVAAFGFAQGSYKGVKGNHWRIPASWKVGAAKLALLLVNASN